MKFVEIFSIILVVLCLSKVESARIRRVAGGVPSVKGENLDFCYLTINFYQKQQTCGCLIWDHTHVVTTARCVIDCSEKNAANITVTFPFKNGADKNVGVRKIFIPDGVFGNPVVPKYDETMDTPSNKFVGNNFAVLRLEKAIITDLVTAAMGEPYTPYQPTITDFLTTVQNDYPNPIYRVCGVGAINNKGERPKDVMCAEVDIIDPASGNCKSTTDGTAFTVPEGGVFCVQYKYGENNMCSGDFGGPIYVYSNVDKSKYLSGAIGLAIGSPDIRSNAPCQDGHTIFAQYFTEPISNYIHDIDPNLSIRKRITSKNHIKKKFSNSLQ